MTPESIGRRIAKRRAQLRLTQEALARKCGCGVGTIRSLEQDGNRGARMATLRKLSEHLGLSTDELIGVKRRVRA